MEQSPSLALPRLVANPVATREIVKSAAAMLLQLLGPAANQWKPLAGLLIDQVLRIFFPETVLPAPPKRAQEPAPPSKPAPAQPAVSPATHAQPDTATWPQTQPTSPPVSTSPATNSRVTVARRAAATPKQPKKLRTPAVLTMAPRVENRMLSVVTVTT